MYSHLLFSLNRSFVSVLIMLNWFIEFLVCIWLRKSVNENIETLFCVWKFFHFFSNYLDLVSVWTLIRGRHSFSHDCCDDKRVFSAHSCFYPRTILLRHLLLFCNKLAKTGQKLHRPYLVNRLTFSKSFLQLTFTRFYCSSNVLSRFLSIAFEKVIVFSNFDCKAWILPKN